MIRIIFLSLLVPLSFIAGCGGGESDQAAQELEHQVFIPPTPSAQWEVPDCDEIFGPAAFTISKDGGESILNNVSSLFVGEPAQIALTSTPNYLVASLMVNLELSFYRSYDAGCSWEAFDTPDDDIPVLSTSFYPAPDGSVYSIESSSRPKRLFRVDKDLNRVRELTIPETGTLEASDLYIAANNAEHLRVISARQVYDSSNGGMTWLPVGIQHPGGNGNGVAFNSRDGDHVVVGSGDALALVTFNGGETWQYTQLPPDESADYIIGSDSAISSVDTNIVWMEGRNLDAEARGEKRTRLYLSSDGGVSFNKVLESAIGAWFFGPIWPHPQDPLKVYFVDGSTIYLFDANTGEVITHQHEQSEWGWGWFRDLRFSPADPNLLYFTRTLPALTP